MFLLVLALFIGWGDYVPSLLAVFNLNFFCSGELFLKFDSLGPQKLRKNRIMLNYYVSVFF